MTTPNSTANVPGIAVEAFADAVANPNVTSTGTPGEAVATPVVSADAPQETPVTNDRPRDDQGRFTSEQVEKIRQQEKDKLYSRLESMNTELEVLRKEREAREAAEAARLAEVEAEKARLAEEELSVKELLQKKEQEWQDRFNQLEQAREADRVLLERERQFAELNNYRTQAIQAASENIIPDLIDLVSGNTPEEIDASIAHLTERSARILDGVAQAAQQQRQAMRTVSPTGAAPVGPMDNNPNYETITADDISNMDMATYAKNRERLMKAASRRDRGLFG